MAGDIGSVLNNPLRKDHWIKRGIAYIIDSIIIYVVFVIIVMLGTFLMVGAIIGGAMTGAPIAGVAGGLMILFALIIVAIVFSIGYWIYFDAKGGTPGKKFMKLRPIALQGEMDYTKAAIRNGSKIVGGFIGSMVEGAVGIVLIGLVIEIIIVLLDVYLGITSGKDPRQKYTDTIANTTVVRTDIEEDVEGMRYVPSLPTPPPMPAPISPPEPQEISSSASTQKSASTPEHDTTPLTLTEAESASVKKEPEEIALTKTETVEKYMELFEINQERASELYDAGYKRLEDFQDAIVEDLILVDKINPTIARSIINKIPS